MTALTIVIDRFCSKCAISPIFWKKYGFLDKPHLIALVGQFQNDHFLCLSASLYREKLNRREYSMKLNIPLYLISNAIKYSPPKPAIQIACVKVDGKAIFSICDQGIGIRKEDLPKLFERYYRVQESKTKNISGFGVGLYLCYEIIM